MIDQPFTPYTPPWSDYPNTPHLIEPATVQTTQMRHLLAENGRLRDELATLEHDHEYVMMKWNRLKLRVDGDRAHRHIDMALMFALGLMLGVISAFLIWSTHGMMHT